MLRYYNRTLWTKGIRRALPHAAALVIALTAMPAARSQTPRGDGALTAEDFAAAGVPPEAAAQFAQSAARSVEFDDEYAPAGRPPVAVRVLVRPGAVGQQDRILLTAKAALALFDEWYGPYPSAHLTVVDLPWNSAFAGASYPGFVAIATRLIAPARDVSLERTLLAAIARLYWRDVGPADGSQGWFQEGLVLYSGARAMHQYLDGRHFASVRALNGFVPYVIRSVSLTPRIADPRPRIRHFPELDEPATAPWRAWPAEAAGEAQRVAAMLATLERYIGWPAMQAAMATFRTSPSAPAGTVQDFARILSAQRGQDMTWFFDEALRRDARFDYAIERVASESSPAHPGRFRTVVSLARRGTGVFAGTSRSAAGGDGDARSLIVNVTFEDGTVVSDWFDGRHERVELTYESASPPVFAAADPDMWLLLDADRRNNFRATGAPPRGVAARPTAHWLIWLQDLLVTYTALL